MVWSITFFNFTVSFAYVAATFIITILVVLFTHHHVRVAPASQHSFNTIQVHLHRTNSNNSAIIKKKKKKKRKQHMNVDHEPDEAAAAINGFPTMHSLDVMTDDGIASALDSLLLFCSDEEMLIALIKRLLVGSEHVDTYFEQLESGNAGSRACAYVFKAHEPAYQCRTCGVDPTCIQCMKCFRNADHSGHDIIMTHAGGGGCCDCGDASSWDQAGFCTLHSSRQEVPEVNAAELSERAVTVVKELLRVLGCVLLQRQDCNFLMDSMMPDDGFTGLDGLHTVSVLNDDTNSFMHVISTFEHIGCENADAEAIAHRAHNAGRALLLVADASTCDEAVDQLESAGLHYILDEIADLALIISHTRAQALLQFLASLCRISSAFRDIICAEMLLSSACPPSSDVEENNDAVGSSFMAQLMSCTFGLSSELNAALCELNFQLFTNAAFKQQFALEFTRQYAALLDTDEVNPEGADSVLDYSVQLYTIPDMVCTLVAEHGLIDSFLGMISDVLCDHLDENGVLCCDLSAAHSQPPFESKLAHMFKDLHFILNNTGVPELLLREPKAALLLRWCQILRMLERMDAQTRHSGATHVEYESATWLSAFRNSLRSNQVSSVLLTAFEKLLAASSVAEHSSPDFWLLRDVLAPLLDSVVNKLVVPNTWHWTPSASSSNRAAVPDLEVDTDPVSFHFPLRRFVVRMALRFCQSTGKSLRSLFEDVHVPLCFFDEDDDEVPEQVDDEEQMPYTVVHPMVLLADPSVQLLAAVSHMRASIWVLNGTTMLHQEHNYGRVEIRDWFCDADLELSAALAVVLGGDQFVQVLAYRFLLHDFLVEEQRLRWSSEKVLKAAEYFWNTLVVILSSRWRFAETSTEQKEAALRHEMIQWLMVSDLTHSAALDKLSGGSYDPSLSSEILHRVLDHVADFIEPRHMESGRYSLRPALADHFDPFFAKYSNEERSKAEHNFLLRSPHKPVVFPPMPCSFPSFLPCFAGIWDILSSPSTATFMHSVFMPSAYTSSRQILCAIRLLQIGLSDCVSGRVGEDRSAAFLTSITSPSSSSSSSVLSSLCSAVKADLDHIRTHAHVAKHLIAAFATADARAASIAVSFGLAPDTTADEAPAGKVAEGVRLAERALRRQRAQERALRRIEEQKARFTSANRDALEAVEVEVAGTTDHQQQQLLKCIVCRSIDGQAEIGVLGYIGWSRVPQQLCRPRQSRCASVTKENDDNENNLPWFVIAKSCGHAMHASCLDRHQNTLLDLHRHQQPHEGAHVVDITDAQITCPLCKCSSNALIPSFPSAVVAASEQEEAFFSSLEALQSESDVDWLRSTAGQISDRLGQVFTSSRIPFWLITLRSSAVSVMDARVAGRIHRFTKRDPSTAAAAGDFEMSDDQDDQVRFELLVRVVADTISALEFASRLNADSAASEREMEFVTSLMRSCSGMLAFAAPDMQEFGFGAFRRGFAQLDPLKMVVACALSLWSSSSLALSTLETTVTEPERAFAVLSNVPVRGARPLLHRAMRICVQLARLGSGCEQSDPNDHVMLALLRQMAILWHCIGGRNVLIPNTMDEGDFYAFLDIPTVPNEGLAELLRPTVLGLTKFVVPQLMELPARFDDLFQLAASAECKHCSRRPSSPALCLVCGAMLCAAGTCCTSSSPNRMGELSRHTKQHCGQHGAFLLLNDSHVLFIFDGFDMRVSSPYLDAHGEEDSGLRRGKPLFLDQERWRRIQSIFVNHDAGSYVSRKRSYKMRLYQRNTF